MLRPMFFLSLAALAVSAVLRASISHAVADVAPISAVMGSINIEPGQVAGDVSDVNGSIHIGEHATVANVGGVNGSIHIAQGANAGSLHTVNGSIHVGPGAHISKTINTVNGSIAVDSGTDVKGSVWTVNGGMTLTGAHVGGEVRTVNGAVRLHAAHVEGEITDVNGAIEIGAGSRVDRGLHIQPNSRGWFSFFFPRTPPRIVIGPEAVVSGTLRFEQEVTLYVSDHARIGPVQGATPIRFSGAQPPD